MEDNEQNQMLALQVLNMVSEGCCLQLLKPKEVLLAVGYAEMWLERNAMFYCELGNGTTGKQHVLKFASFTPRSTQVLFYDEAGTLIAGLAPFKEWPEVDAGDLTEAWHEWQKELPGSQLEACQNTARIWRKSDFSDE